MTNLTEREKAFEAKYQHDQEVAFKVNVRRNKLLGLWAAALLGKGGADAETYAKAVIAADFEKAGDSDVFEKIRRDFDAAGVQQSDHQIRRTMDELMQKAIAQVQTETP